MFTILKIILNDYPPSHLKEILPKKILGNDPFEYKWDEFEKKLGIANIFIEKQGEPFIDEDTGEIVIIPRSGWKFSKTKIKRKKRGTTLPCSKPDYDCSEGLRAIEE